MGFHHTENMKNLVVNAHYGDGTIAATEVSLNFELN